MFSLKRAVPLAPYTTFQVGGQAECFTEAAGAFELAEACEFAEHEHLSVFVLGGGSNVLFSDAGFSGLVVRMTDGGLRVDGERITAGAGIRLWDVVRAANAAGLEGMERLAGVPGSLGGAIRGNAGAFGTEVRNVVASVKTFERSTGMVREFANVACGFGYRMSEFKRRPDTVIVSAELKLVSGERAALERISEETVAQREAKHPQDVRSAGSFFMNPTVTDPELRAEFERDNGVKPKDNRLPAGWVIDHVGLRGKRIGGAMVSHHHPNYILNVGDATAEDIITLASLIKTRVRDELGIRLREEVQLVGF